MKTAVALRQGTMDLFGTHEGLRSSLLIDAWGTEARRESREEGYSRARVFNVDYTLIQTAAIPLFRDLPVQNLNGPVRQAFYLPRLVQWYTPAEALKMATADNAELLAMSGPRNPCPGKPGVVQEGALADLLLVDGDPIANIKLLEDPAKNLVLIIKDGKIHKNTLSK